MKFSNGCWLQKEGCACFSPAEVYFTKIEKDKVVLCAPTHKINHRGDTLGGINLTVEITTPMPEVIRVKTYHYKGAIQDGPQFALNLPKQTAIDATEDDEKIVVKSGNAKLVITKENWSMTYYNGDKKLSTSAWRDLAYMKTDWKGDAYVKSADKDAYMRQQLSLGVGELIYGLGERFAAFTRNGQSIDIWNEDGGTSTDQSYKNIPFYISNKGYGVFVNHTEKVSFEVATEAVTKVEFSVPGESLDYFFFNGPDLKDVLRRYTDLTGKPALPPAWTFGLWLSTSFTTNYDEKTVMSFIDGMLDRGIPLKVFHFDCFWMKDFHWTDFLWDERVFPDPEGMLSRSSSFLGGLKRTQVNTRTRDGSIERGLRLVELLPGVIARGGCGCESSGSLLLLGLGSRQSRLGILLFLLGAGLGSLGLVQIGLCSSNGLIGVIELCLRVLDGLLGGLVLVHTHGLELGLGIIEGLLGLILLCLGVLERLGLILDTLVGLFEPIVQVAQLLLLLLGLFDGGFELVNLLLERGDFCCVLLDFVVAHSLRGLILLLLRLLLRLAREN